MRLLSSISILVALCVTGAGSPVLADGLVYQLPEDGTSITFDAEMTGETGGRTQSFAGTMTMSSVGKETVDGKACRWIEFTFVLQISDRERKISAKALVPEEELKKGKNPAEHVKKAWFLPPNQEPREVADLSDTNAGPLPAFLAGPLKDQKMLPEEMVKSGLGELKCPGVSGTTSFKQGSRTHKFTFKNRLHEKAPFGVVSTEIKFTSTREGGDERGGTMKLTAKKIDTGAKSEIQPNK